MRLSGALLLLVGCASERHLARPGPARAEAPTCLAGVRVLDGVSDVLTGPMNVTLAYGRVESMTPATEAVPAGCRDARGKTLMPGLIDSHAHVGLVSGLPPWDVRLPDAQRHMEMFLASGVTTVLTPEGGDWLADLARELARGERFGPTLRFASRIFTARDGHPTPLYRAGVSWPVSDIIIDQRLAQLSPTDDVAAAVERELPRAPDFFKVVYDQLPVGGPQLSLAQLTALIREGRRVGVRVVVHVGSAREAVEAAQAGASMLMHVPWQDELSDADVAAIAATKVPVVTTRRVMGALDDAIHERLALHELERFVCPSDCEASFAHRPKDFVFRGYDASFEAGLAAWDTHLGVNVQKLHAAGVVLLAGTDSGLPGVLQGASLHRELQALVALGLSPSAVLKMATSTAAKVLEPARRVGVIEPGAEADLLLIDGDPLTDISTTERILGVWRGGREVLRGAPEAGAVP